ncbi:MAG: glutathione synthase [Alphaproteobacteria bacterium]|nr:MAG: glutathione synthase [Alphaproteobacteria bacterium]
MIKTIAVQMDDIGQLNLPHDNTFFMMREAAKRGYKIFYYTPDNLFAAGQTVKARGHFVDIPKGKIDYKLSDAQDFDLSASDAILIRQDPPFDMAYVTTTLLLDLIAHKTLVLNNPKSLRDYPEKILPLHFPSLIPATLVSAEYGIIEEFYKKQGEIVVKPIYGRHGQRVFYIKADDKNFESIVRTMLAYGQPIIAQKFLPDIYDGSKRVIMINGEVIATMKNVPPKGSILSGYSDRSPYQVTELTPAQKKICDTIGPFMAKAGLFLAGIDLIGDYLIEINVTSPSGLIPIEQLYNKNAVEIFWNMAENQLVKLRQNAA